MTDISKLIRDLKRGTDVSKGLGISSQIAELARAHQIWKQNISGFEMLVAAAKEASRQNKTFSTSADIARSLQNAIKVPNTLFDSFKSINQNHIALVGGWNGISNLVLINRLNAWKSAIVNISSQVATLSVADQKWELIDEFKTLSDETTNLSESIVEKKSITNADIKKLFDIIQRVEVKIDKHDIDYLSVIYKYVFIIYAIIFIISHVLEWSKPDAATKIDIEKAKTEILTTLQNKIWQNANYRTTNRACKVFTKPNTKSSVVSYLPKDFSLTVLNVKHKWVSVTYLSPIDSFPATGWILKKYLSLPKVLAK